MNIIRFPLLLGLLSFALIPARAEGFYDSLRVQAEKEAPGEVQLHIIETHKRLSDFVAKVRKVEKVPGWQRIRVEGDAAFSHWDSYRKDYVWRKGKFEVLFEITSSQKLKLNSVTFEGRTTKADT